MSSAGMMERDKNGIEGHAASVVGVRPAASSSSTCE